MPKINVSTLLRRLRDRPASAAVFLHGPEEYLRESAVRRSIELVLDPPTQDFNLDQVRGGEVAPEALASLLATPPLMAEYRVVVVREAQGLSPKGRAVVENALEESLAGLVLILTGTIPGGSKAKFYQKLQTSALSVEFPAVDALDLPAWVVEHARGEHGVEIDVDAARALAAAIGSQLGILATELEKVVAYVGDRGRITREDVKAVGGYVPQVDRWKWFDTVGGRRFAEAVNELPELLAAGETGVGLVMGLGSHILRLGLLVAGGREGLDRNIPPHQRWLVRHLYPQSRRWRLAQIDLALADLLRADRLLKSASLTDRQALEELLLRLAAGDPEAPVQRARRRGELPARPSPPEAQARAAGGV